MIENDNSFEPNIGKNSIDNYIDQKTKKPIFYGYNFPLKDNGNGIMATIYDIELIKADLVQLLMTIPGERVMEPDFGVGLQKLLYDQSNINLYEEIRSQIINAIDTWEKRIVVHSIEVGPYIDEVNGETNEKIVMVKIMFALKEDVQNISNLTLNINSEL